MLRLRSALLLLLVASPLAAQSKGLKVGDTAPAPATTTVDGAPATLADVVGKKPAIVEFWATWCPLCRRLEPTVKQLAETHGDRLAIVRIAVNANQSREQVKAFIAKYQLPGTFFYDGDGSVYRAFAAYHTSYIVVLDRHGKVVHSDDGAEQDLPAAVSRAVATP